MTAFTESIVEEAALEWFGALGYSVIAAPSTSQRKMTFARGDRSTRGVR